MGPRKTEEDAALNFVTLDNDVWGEVLSRLNFQDLCKLKCVSKDFRDFIGQPECVAYYKRNWKPIAGKGLTGLFSNERVWEHNRETVKIGFDLVEPEAGKLPGPALKFLRQGAGDIDIIDSCNGLLFYIFNQRANNAILLFVCNPLTKEKLMIPSPEKESQGLSFALAADLDGDYLRYEVLCLRTKNGGVNSILSIFSSGTGEWSEISDNLPPVPPVTFDTENSLSRVFFKGSLYWDCFEGLILVFRLNPEKGEPCCELIESPMTSVLGRSLWKSEDELHYYCHGVDPEIAVWTLCFDEDILEWKNDPVDCDRFRNLDHVYSYQCCNRGRLWVREMFNRSDKPLSLHFEKRVLPYAHSLVDIQRAKAAIDAPRG